MVSSSPRGGSSRGRLLQAAAREFAARGFDGAKVDRIAARARINKAMLYYHFDDKAALYRAILTDMFATVATAVAVEHARGGPADDQLRRYIRVLARQISERPSFPALWLREMAEGGRHLDASIVAHLRQVLEVLTAILEQGRAEGLFRRAHPLVVQMTVVGPLLVFLASAPMRARFGVAAREAAPALPVDVMVQHVETAALAALGADVPARTARLQRSSP